MTHRLSGLAQRICVVDDRCDLSGFDQLLEGDQILELRRHEKSPQRLAPEPEQHCRAEQSTGAGEPVIAEIPGVWDEYSCGGERASKVGQRMVRHVVEDEVVALPA